MTPVPNAGLEPQSVGSTVLAAVRRATGRSAADIHPDVAEIGFDGAVTNSGALVTSGDDVVIERPLPRAATDRMLRRLPKPG